MPKKRRGRANAGKDTGRKPDITEEQMAKLEMLLQNGNSIIGSCVLSNVKPGTYHSYCAKADVASPRKIYVEFATRMRRAQELFVADSLKLIADAGRGTSDKPGDWRARAWLLERRRPDEFAPRERVDVRHRGTIGHQHELKAQIVIVMPQAIASPRPRPTIDARATPLPPKPADPAP